MNILAIGPHPDDIEIGCSGTLIKYAQQGHGVFLLIITKGEKGGDPETRHEEQLKAAEIMGARDVFWGGLQIRSCLTGATRSSTLLNCISRGFSPILSL